MLFTEMNNPEKDGTRTPKLHKYIVKKHDTNRHQSLNSGVGKHFCRRANSTQVVMQRALTFFI